MWVLKPGRRLDFGEEAFGAECSGELRVQHLDCDVAIVAEIACEIDSGHPAGAKLALHAVAVGECRLKLLEKLVVGH